MCWVTPNFWESALIAEKESTQFFIWYQILDELEYSGLGRNRELSARMLGRLISNAPRFMRQFVEPIMTVLVPKLKDKDPNPAVIMCILTAVGDLAQVN